MIEGFAYDLGVGSYNLAITGAPSAEVSMVYVPPVDGEDEHMHDHNE